ncbi:MAG: threonine--tRNA ligase, partial [Anaerolineales bacterium]|nr:threonine--tRNA ligase [Anaerolineales bacterium]
MNQSELGTLRHSTAHVMAHAVRNLFPGVKIAIGPAIEDGFYYDFDVPNPFTPEDLDRISAEMTRIVEKKSPFVRREVSRDEALEMFKDEPYKLELIREMPDEEVISVYEEDGFIDLCRGPHLANTGEIKAFKLLSVAGAYWRGDERNPMLQRIYGTAFPTQAELDEYLHRLEE